MRRRKVYLMVGVGIFSIIAGNRIYQKSLIEGNSMLESSFAIYGDAAIFMYGRSGGEGKDILATGNPDTLDGNYLQFTQTELDLLD